MPPFVVDRLCVGDFRFVWDRLFVYPADAGGHAGARF